MSGENFSGPVKAIPVARVVQQAMDMKPPAKDEKLPDAEIEALNRKREASLRAKKAWATKRAKKQTASKLVKVASAPTAPTAPTVLVSLRVILEASRGFDQGDLTAFADMAAALQPLTAASRKRVLAALAKVFP